MINYTENKRNTVISDVWVMLQQVAVMWKYAKIWLLHEIKTV